MRIKVSQLIEHRSLTVTYLPRENQMRESLVLPGAGCSIGCCCSSCGAISQ